MVATTMGLHPFLNRRSISTPRPNALPQLAMMAIFSMATTTTCQEAYDIWRVTPGDTKAAESEDLGVAGWRSMQNLTDLTEVLLCEV